MLDPSSGGRHHNPDARGKDEPAIVRWELIDAPFGSGSWLVAFGVAESHAWAPPGVILSGDDDEPVQWWTCATWNGDPDCLSRTPDELWSVSVADVHNDVPADFRPWVITCTEGQLKVLARYLRFAARETEAVQQAGLTLSELRGELAALRRSEAQIGLTAQLSKQLQQSFSALSDHDFALLVSDVIGTELNAEVTYAGSTSTRSYLMAVKTAGLRILLQIRHDLTNTPRQALIAAQREAERIGPCEGDEHWLITSAPLPRDPDHDAGFWGHDRGRLCDARGLQDLFSRHPTTVARHVKYRVAAELGLNAFPHRDEPPAWYAETEAAERARTQLAEEGLVIVTGARGTGKTTLGHLLLADARLDGYEPALVKGAREFAMAIECGAPTTILWDDFEPSSEALHLLGRTRGADHLKLILTTAALGHVEKKGIVSLNHYSRRDRARILYNQFWSARRSRRSETFSPAHFLGLIDSPLFSPRLVEEVAWREPSVVDDHGSVLTGPEPDEESSRLIERIRVGASWSCDDR
jgi:hypothetical protein